MKNTIAIIIATASLTEKKNLTQFGKIPSDSFKSFHGTNKKPAG